VQATEVVVPETKVATTFGFGVTLPPATTEPLAGLHFTLKSKAATLNTTVVVRDCPLFIPVTMTETVPAVVKVHDNAVTWLGGRVTLGAIEQAALLDDNATTPLKPVEPLTVIDAVSATPVPPLIGPLFERAKSVTVNENCGLAEWAGAEQLTLIV
jgi:hypothetical protein